LTTQITQEDNLILQSYYTVVLLNAISKNKLENSDYFENLDIVSPIKSAIKEIGVDNQGCALMVLYAMLVLPKELIENEFSIEYESVNEFLQNEMVSVETNYRNEDKDDVSTINFVRHLRNSVAHARVSFTPNISMQFSDSRGNQSQETFKAVFPLNKLGELINKLQNVHLEYIKSRNNQ
jgi:hypothetical protein